MTVSNRRRRPHSVVSRFYSPRLEFLEGRFHLSVSLRPQEAWGMGTLPYGVAAADLNGDQVTDLVSANSASDNLSVRIGMRTGGYTSPTTFNVGDSPLEVAVGDVNGDGFLDLISANYNPNNSPTANDTVSVLIGNGDGTFQAQQTYSVGSDPFSVTLADLNLDNRLDVVTANTASDNISILLRNGDGTFALQQTFATGDGPASVRAGDVNGDGKPDLVTANSNSSNVSILVGNGDGTFQAAVQYACGSGPYEVALSDLNGDGKLDVVVASFDTSSLNVLLGNGDATFQSFQPIAVDGSPYSATVADINGDGRPDLISAGQSNGLISVSEGNGDGTFQPPRTFPGRGNPYQVIAADLNRDARLDLVTANGFTDDISVLINQSSLDLFLQTRQPFMSPHGRDREGGANLGFDFVSLPPVVLPGQQVTTEVQWNIDSPINPSAVVFMNAFGDWRPGQELGRLLNGTLAGSGGTATGSFTFTAPTTPGDYRIRLPFVEAFAPVQNFYGTTPGGVNAPGVGPYTEVSFRVAYTPQPDYMLLQPYPNAGFISPFGRDTESASNILFDHVSVPPKVLPGQTVTGEVAYGFVNPNNANALIYLNAIGDWQPGSELARFENGTLVGPGRSESRQFQFQAPTQPGTYRIRIPFVEAFAPVSNFYGTAPAGVGSPGVGAFTEVSFEVSVPPTTDYFLTTGQPFGSPFGRDQESSSDIGYDYVSVPALVLPGESVTGELRYGFTNPNNPNAVIYLNAFGNWAPGNELARFENGTLVGGTRTEERTFSFTAPIAPGRYCIRIPLVEAFAPVSNFYGTPPGGVNNPGVGPYTEVQFEVQSPPVVNGGYYAYGLPQAPVVVSFSNNVSSSLGLDDLILTNLTTSQVVPSSFIALDTSGQTNTATLRFIGFPNGVLPDGDYELRVRAAGVFSGSGIFMAQDALVPFFVLAGDADRDRTVNISDFAILAANFNRPGAFSQGDFNDSGTVEIGDFAILASRYNTALPRDAATSPAVVAGVGSSPVAASAGSHFSDRRILDLLTI